MANKATTPIAIHLDTTASVRGVECSIHITAGDHADVLAQLVGLLGGGTPTTQPNPTPPPAQTVEHGPGGYDSAAISGGNAPAPTTAAPQPQAPAPDATQAAPAPANTAPPAAATPSADATATAPAPSTAANPPPTSTAPAAEPAAAAQPPSLEAILDAAKRILAKGPAGEKELEGIVAHFGAQRVSTVPKERHAELYQMLQANAAAA